jgi:hydroxybutyrate-dimer hydrolase
MAGLTAMMAIVSGCGGVGTPGDGMPDFVQGDLQRTYFDGKTNDLLTGGLGSAGLATATPPAFADPANPTAAELRTRAIHANYRALVDMTPGGGYGSLYGPAVGIGGAGMIAGHEYLALADGGRRHGITSWTREWGGERVTLMVQVPDGFAMGQACIVTAPSSGSRGVYGAIATAGEWGLKRGCAVAYTDKGTGMGVHDLDRDTVNLITGERVAASAEPANAQSDRVNFRADLSEPERAAFVAANPHRLAWKHAHSRDNPESHWGEDVLNSIELAFAVLNRYHAAPNGRKYTPENTVVIASSVSNGGGASLRAAEEDRGNLIDGVAVSEPNVQPRFDPSFAIRQGDGSPVRDHSRPLLDYITLVNLYEPCAALSIADAPFNTAASAGRCEALARGGLLKATTTAAQAVEAQAAINAHGILPEQNFLQPSYNTFFVPQSIAVTYANAYTKAGVEKNLCGYGFAYQENGVPAPLSKADAANLFAIGNGIPPTGKVVLINNDAPGGPREDRSSTPDQNTAGALCLRALATGTDPVTGNPLTGEAADTRRRVEEGIAAVQATGNPRGKPVVIVQGRADGIIPPNHAARPYYALALIAEKRGGDVRYYEVTNATHLDAFNAFPGFDARYVPLHAYYFQALDLMWDHLVNGAPLPPSQVVRTVPRGPGAGIGMGAPPIGPANLPPIRQDASADSLIRFDGATLSIPE